MSEGFGRAVARGFASVALGRAIGFVTNLVVAIVITRVLSPDEIGLVTIATVCAGVAEVFGQIGLTRALVQRDAIEPRHLVTAFWTDTSVGVGLALVFVALAPLIGLIYQDPRLIPLLAALSLSFPLTALGKVHYARIQRELRFADFTKAEVVSAVIAGTVAIIAVLSGLGVWAVVIRLLLQRALDSIAYYLYSRWVPWLAFDRDALADLLSFSLNLFGAEVFRYVASSIDRLLMGGLFSTDTLGYYSRASALVVQPLGQAMQAVVRVLFPALSRVQSDHDTVRRTFIVVLGVLALGSFPIVVVLVALADDIIAVVLGERWLPAAGFVRVLAPILVWNGLSRLSFTFYTSLGRADLTLRMTVITRLVLMATTIAGIRWGPYGMAWGYLLGNAVGAVVQVVVALRVIRLDARAVARPLLEVGAATAVMALGVGLAAMASPPLAHGARLAAGAAVAVTAYGLGLLIVRPEPMRQVIRVVRRRRQRREPGTPT